MFLYIFSLLLLVANIYCFIRKKYLYLFVPCMLFLPEYYGIEISSSLPIVTVTRMMFVVFYVYAFINRRNTLSPLIRDKKFLALPKSYYFLIFYFVFRLISNLRYVTTYGQSIKTIFLLIFEQLLLLIAFYLISPTHDEIIKIVKSVVWSASGLFFIGIVESLTFFRPFDSLYTVSRYLLNDHYIRMGLLRATTTMGLPGIFGNMCVLIFPLILYLYNYTQQKRYIFLTGLCTLAIIHSGCRSDLLYLFALLFVYFVLIIRNKTNIFNFIRHTIAVVLGIAAFCILLSFANNVIRYYYVTSAKSVLNSVGFEFDLNEDSPDSSVSYGLNEEASSARKIQLSGIYYVAKRNPIFGFGSGAQHRDDLKYFTYNKWQNIKTYDVGLVEIFCDEGLLGTLGIISLLIFAFTLSSKEKKKNIYYFLGLVAYLLTTLSTINLYSFIFLYIIFLINESTTQITTATERTY